MALYFTSDHHFDHLNIIKFCNRPFSSVKEMNEALVERYNAVVKDDDIVFFVGDFAWSERALHQYAPRLKGKKTLIPGNHDSCHPVHKKHLQKAELYGKYFEVLGTSYELNDLTITHMPPKDEGDPRPYDAYRPKEPHPQRILVHGHVHDRWKVKGRCVNVSVEMWDYHPVPLEDIYRAVESSH